MIQPYEESVKRKKHTPSYLLLIPDGRQAQEKAEELCTV
jgi:hypothetical protein